MGHYAKILHPHFRVIINHMPDRIPPIPNPIRKRLALRSMLDRLYVRGQICHTCRTVRLLLILGIGLVIGLILVG